MKSILTFIFLLIFAFNYCEAEDSVESYRGVKVLKNLGEHNYILCIEGYQWLKFNGYVPQQMFYKHINSLNIIMLPVSCN